MRTHFILPFQMEHLSVMCAGDAVSSVNFYAPTPAGPLLLGTRQTANSGTTGDGVSMLYVSDFAFRQGGITITTTIPCAVIADGQRVKNEILIYGALGGI